MNVRKAVITAAGKGTRQYPATQGMSKVMIPLVDRDGLTKPTIQIIIEEALASGIEEIGLVVAPEDEAAFRAYFRGMDAGLRERFAKKPWGLGMSDRLEEIGRRLTTIVQPTAEGYGHAVWCAKEWVGGEPFALVLGDHVYVSGEERTTTRQVLDVAARYDLTTYSVQRTPEERIRLYGTIGAEPVPGDPCVYRVTAVREKPDVEIARRTLHPETLPPDEYLCMFGVNVLTPAIFDCLDELVRGDIRERGEIQFASAQAMYVERYRTIACEVNGDRYDMGNPLGMIEAQTALALNSVYRDDLLAFLAANTADIP